MSGFDLSAVVYRVFQHQTEHDLPRDQETIASLVMARIPEELSRVALQQIITGYIKQRFGQTRMLVPVAGEKRKPRPSTKVTAIRDAWRRQLDGVYSVPSEDGGSTWKRLGEMSYDELLAAASVRKEHARKNMAKAEYLERVAEALVTHGVACPDLIPESDPLAVAA